MVEQPGSGGRHVRASSRRRQASTGAGRSPRRGTGTAATDGPPLGVLLIVAAVVLGLIAVVAVRAQREDSGPAQGAPPTTGPDPVLVAVVERQTAALREQSRLQRFAAGTREGWNTDDRPAPGVFVGLLPGEKLPTRVPQHAACENASPRPIRDVKADGDQSMTVVFSDCPGVDYTFERVIQVNASQLLWVQVRSDDRPTANRVLDSVTTSGI